MDKARIALSPRVCAGRVEWNRGVAVSLRPASAVVESFGEKAT
jgi:hypothetical protein